MVFDLSQMLDLSELKAMQEDMSGMALKGEGFVYESLPAVICPVSVPPSV